jgi:glycosyltransferase involved in cell wall biosynthesis
MGSVVKSIVIALPNLAQNDAIGNDVLAEYMLLTDKGFKVQIFAEYYDNKLSAMICGFKDARKADAIIYHHSVNWRKGQKLLAKHSGAIRILRYHNITPGEFFENYSCKMARISYKGRKQTSEIIPLFSRCWPASKYNMDELVQAGADPQKCKVMPPLHYIEELGRLKADEGLKDRLKSGKKPVVLFVGRQVPNKGMHHFARVAEEYVKAYGRNALFVWTGGKDARLHGYHAEIEGFISKNHLNDVVLLPGKVSAQELRAWYDGSSAFLCMSEHEGFCVPVIEAQALGVPVVALDRAAVGETVGENGLVFAEPEYERFAATLHEILNNVSYADYLIAQGKMNFENRFSKNILEEEFEKEIEYIMQ